MARRLQRPTTRSRKFLGVAAGLVGLAAVVAGAALYRPGAVEPAAGGDTPSAPGIVADATITPSEPPSDRDATPLPTFEPLGSATPAVTRPVVTIEPDPIPDRRIATRVVVPGLGVDLPVTRQTTTYPACGVAMYLMNLHQPGQGGVTYLYAHAQSGNFLPILTESLVNDGARMVGMAIEVYTGDSLKFTYRIVEVRRHVTNLDGAFAWQGESVFLQTSEGPGASTPKLQVVGEIVAMGPASFEASHPQPHPVVCR
jgi:hypothetical protein